MVKKVPMPSKGSGPRPGLSGRVLVTPEQVEDLVRQLLIVEAGAEVPHEDYDSTEASDQARRDLLGISASLLEAGDPLSDHLRRWLARRLVDLHTALDGGDDGVDEKKVRAALVGLGRRPRGRQAKPSVGHDEWSGPGIAAAAAVLEALAAPGEVAGIDEALAAAANTTRSTVQLARHEHLINMGEGEESEGSREELRELAFGLARPLLARLRDLADRTDPHVHVQIRDLLRRHPRT
jgi:hypothetical protein